MTKRLRNEDISLQITEKLQCFEFRSRQKAISVAKKLNKTKEALAMLGPVVAENVTYWVQTKIPRVATMLKRDFLTFLDSDDFDDKFSGWFVQLYGEDAKIEDFYLVMLHFRATDEIIASLLHLQALYDSLLAVRDTESVDTEIHQCLQEFACLLSQDRCMKKIAKDTSSSVSKSTEEWKPIVFGHLQTLIATSVGTEHTFPIPPRFASIAKEWLEIRKIRVDIFEHEEELTFRVL